jgi:hypothetical protein
MTLRTGSSNSAQPGARRKLPARWEVSHNTPGAETGTSRVRRVHRRYHFRFKQILLTFGRLQMAIRHKMGTQMPYAHANRSLSQPAAVRTSQALLHQKCEPRPMRPTEGRDASSQLTPSAPTDCPICALTSPSCMPPIAGTQSTYLLIVGDQGRNNGPGHNWNEGYSFGLAAQQQANNLNAQGHRIIACRATMVQDFSNELTTNGVIDGGVIYFGHAGRSTVSGITYSALFVGQDPVTNENLYSGNISTLSGSQLGPNAAVTLNACDTALPAPGGAPIAQALSVQLGRGVYGYAVGLYFSSQNAASDPSRSGAGKQAPGDLPVYMVPEGPPGNKPQPLACTSQGCVPQ